MMKTAFAHLRRKSAILCCLLFSFSASPYATAQSANKALTLSGGGAHAQMGTVNAPGNFSGGLTIECWAKWGAFNSWSRLVDMGNGTAIDNILFANSSTTPRLRFEVYKNGNVEGITSPVVMQAGRWYHVAVTQTDAGLVAIYIDGVPVVSGTIQTPADVQRAFSYIGRSNWDADAYLNGSIDDMRIWNLARCAQDIRRNMLETIPANAPGLVAYYQFNGEPGATLNNKSTNGYAGNGIFSDGYSLTDSPVQEVGNALNLDGVDDHISIGAPLLSGSSYTKEAWIYLTTNLGPRNIISSHLSPFWIDDSRLRAGNTGSMYEVTDATIIPTNTWIHVAVTYDAGSRQLNLYRNGNLVGSAVSTQPYLNSDNFIGAWSNESSVITATLEGTIDEVRIWKVVRTQSEIQTDMNHELDPSTVSDLVSYYTFNQGIASGENTGMTTVIDHARDFNATLAGFSLSGTSSNFVQQQNTIAVLPVRFASFTAQANGGQVALQWTATSEQSLPLFEVEHSTNGRRWNRLATIAGTGNNHETSFYNYLHTNPTKGRNYYRIAQRDRNGKSSYTNVLTVAIERFEQAFAVQNTLVTNGSLQVEMRKPVVLALYAQDGRLVWSKKLPVGKQVIGMGDRASGVYFLKGEGNTEKIVLQ